MDAQNPVNEGQSGVVAPNAAAGGELKIKNEELKMRDGGRDNSEFLTQHSALADRERSAQSPTENAKYARARRQAEREAAELKSRARLTAQRHGYASFEDMESAGGGGKLKMKNEELRIGDEERDNSDFLTPNSELADRSRSAADKVRADMADFAVRYPGVDMIRLVNEDKGFEMFAKGRLGALPLCDLYEGYLHFRKNAADDAAMAAEQRVESRRSRSTSAGRAAAADNFGLSPVQLHELADWNSKHPHLRMTAREYAGK